MTYLPTKVIKRARYRLKGPVNSAGRHPSGLELRQRGLLLGWGLVRYLIFSPSVQKPRSGITRVVESRLFLEKN
jgi:hypothetical protein